GRILANPNLSLRHAQFADARRVLGHARFRWVLQYVDCGGAAQRGDLGTETGGLGIVTTAADRSGQKVGTTAKTAS
ncbi:MAG: hypothetical protein ACI9K8_000971, partial [Reinekea sp.]